MAGFSSLAYILGKLSYIAGQHCMDIFLEQVTIPRVFIDTLVPIVDPNPN